MQANMTDQTDNLCLDTIEQAVLSPYKNAGSKPLFFRHSMPLEALETACFPNYGLTMFPVRCSTMFQL